MNKLLFSLKSRACWPLAVLTAAMISMLATGWATLGPVQAQGYLGTSRSTYQLFILGDDWAGGIWAGSNRLLQADPRFALQGRLKSGSGLVRERLYDWPSALSKILERNTIDIAIFMIGLNDVRELVMDGRVLQFGTDEWREEYGRRVTSIIKLFKARDIPVYWAGLPPVANPAQDQALKLISQIQRAEADKAGIRFIETRPAFSNNDGTFSLNGFDVSGRFRRLRTRNGIRFIKPGNDKLASLFLERIRTDIKVADGLLEPDRPSKAANIGNLPIFGLAAADNSDVTVDPTELPSADAQAAQITASVSAGNQPRDSAVLKNLQRSAPADSNAAILFSTGDWPQSRKGRIDDFSWPQN